jgi:hypothetical protein
MSRSMPPFSWDLALKPTPKVFNSNNQAEAADYLALTGTTSNYTFASLHALFQFIKDGLPCGSHGKAK